MRHRESFGLPSRLIRVTFSRFSYLQPFTSLGDSGFMIIRSSTVFHRQKSQTHFFNCPRYVDDVFTPSTNSASKPNQQTASQTAYTCGLRRDGLSVRRRHIRNKTPRWRHYRSICTFFYPLASYRIFIVRTRRQIDRRAF